MPLHMYTIPTASLGTHAGAFGLVVSRGILLEVLLTDRCGMILQNLTSSAVSDQSRPSWLCVTHALPCAEYALNLSVGASQSAYISYFGFAPCLPSTDGLNPCHFLAQTPSPTPSDVTAPRSVPTSAQPRVRIIFALVFSSLIFGCIVVLLVRRGKRSSAGSGSRFRPPGNDVEHTSSAQVTHLDGGGENDAKSPVSTEMFKLKPPSAAAMPESTPGAEGQSHGPTVGTPQCCFDASIGKPTQCPGGVRIADPESGVEGQFVRSYLPDTNEPTVLAKYEKEYNSELSTLSTNALWGQSCGASAAGRSR